MVECSPTTTVPVSAAFVSPQAIYYVKMKRKFNLHDGFRPFALTGRDYAFNNLTRRLGVSDLYNSCESPV